jgi:hypothetical protein
LPLPNNQAVSPGIVGFQGLGNLGVGRQDNTLGFGGFVFSAASDTFNLLIRALKQQGRLDILSRPQIMTLDNQSARILVGQSVPYVGGTTVTTGIVTNDVNYRDTGVSLQVTPRITPDGRVFMRVIPEISKPQSTQVTLGNGATATAFDVQTIETTIAAQDGETVAIGGLITRIDAKLENKIPWFGDLPWLGTAFRYRTQAKERREIVVILTPHIIRCREDAERLLMSEARRLDWIIGDVTNLHGPSPLDALCPRPDGANGPSTGPGLPPAVPGVPGEQLREVLPPANGTPLLPSSAGAPGQGSVVPNGTGPWAPPLPQTGPVNPPGAAMPPQGSNPPAPPPNRPEPLPTGGSAPPGQR